jgi:hypothetical protein
MNHFKVRFAAGPKGLWKNHECSLSFVQDFNLTVCKLDESALHMV